MYDFKFYNLQQLPVVIKAYTYIPTGYANINIQMRALLKLQRQLEIFRMRKQMSSDISQIQTILQIFMRIFFFWLKLLDQWTSSAIKEQTIFNAEEQTMVFALILIKH